MFEIESKNPDEIRSDFRDLQFSLEIFQLYLEKT